MRYATIQAALFRAWIAADFGVTIVYPDRDAAANTEHVRLSLIPVDSTPATLGPTGANQVTGILQADFHFRTGRGNGEALSVVDAVCAAFPSGLILTEDGQQLAIWGAKLDKIFSDGGWLRAIISIQFTAHVRRQTP